MIDKVREPCGKKLRITICDDEKSVCTSLETMLQTIASELNLEFDIEPSYSGEDFCKYLSHGNKVDLVFLDIELIRLSGIDVGHYIRDELEDMRTQIIYISSKKNYALQLFKTQPFDFLIKPISIDNLRPNIIKLSQILINQNRFFQYQVQRETFQIDYDDIVYFKSEAHKIVIVTMNDEKIFYGKLKCIAENAPDQFFSIHKSYLVNRNYVISYTYSSVELKNAHILSISKPYQKSVRMKINSIVKGKTHGN